MVSDKIIEKFDDKEYRTGFVESRARTLIALQIRALREQRGWSQEEMARHLGVVQSGVSRLEDPDYGRMSVTTLLKVAAVFDVGIIIRFAPYESFLREASDISPRSLYVDTFSQGSLNFLKSGNIKRGTVIDIGRYRNVSIVPASYRKVPAHDVTMEVIQLTRQQA